MRNDGALPATSLYAHQGHNFGPCLDALKAGLVDGIILSPKDIMPATLPKNMRMAGKLGHVLIDPQSYALRWRDDPKAKLGYLMRHSFHRGVEHESFISGKTSRSMMSELISQSKHGADGLIAPGAVISSMLEGHDKRHVRLWEQACTCANELGDAPPLHLTAAIDADVLADDEERDKVIDALTEQWDIAGWYLLPCLRDPDRGRLPWRVIAGMMDLIYELKRAGYTVTVGHCGLEALLYCACGADTVAVGLTKSTRYFCRERWTPSGGGSSTDEPRALFALHPTLLREVRLEDLTAFRSAGSRAWGCDCAYCEVIRTVARPDAHRENWTSCQRANHYFSVVRSLLAQTSSIGDSDGRIGFLQALYATALSTFAELEDRGIVFDRSIDRALLQSWMDALQDFESQRSGE